ncbi:MAG: BA14K family protein [Rhodobiaceae bacterium]|nr:BA14K family protein [Rhodobiaceae bacterium]MCC0056329.1 BA14K family protein [Rhodobiaceae bacterium]
MLSRFKLPTALVAGAAALMAVFVVGTPQPAKAGGFYGYYQVGGGYYYPRYYRYRQPYPRYQYYPRYRTYPGYGYYYRDNNAAVALGIMGAMVGTALANSGARSGWVGTPAWYDYCRRKYKTFDPHTGTYMSNRGYRRTCR